MHMAWGGPTACVKARPAAALAWCQATCGTGGCREVYAHAGRQRGATHSEQAACGHEQVQGTGDVEWLSFLFLWASVHVVVVGLGCTFPVVQLSEDEKNAECSKLVRLFCQSRSRS